MKRDFIIQELINNEEYGFSSIVNSTEEFKKELNAIIEEARVSVPTIKVFLSFCEENIKEKGYGIDLRNGMLNAAIFVTNDCKLDCKRINTSLTDDDMSDMDVINSREV